MKCGAVDEPLTCLRPTTVSSPATPQEHAARVAVGISLVVGGSLLAATVRVEPDSTWFTVLAVLLAATWVGGAMAAGPVLFRPDARHRWQAIVAASTAVGGVSFVVFLGVYLVARNVPVASDALDTVLDKRSERGLIVLALAGLNGVAEEVFFRGAMYTVVGTRHAVVRTTAVYVAVTAVTGNIALIVAASVMGTVFALARRATGSILAPIIIHVTWSTLMLLALPR